MREQLTKIWWGLRSIPFIFLLKIRHRRYISLSYKQDLHWSARFIRFDQGKIILNRCTHLKNGVEINVTDYGVISIGAHTCINSNTHIAAKSSIVIGEYTEIGPNAMIIDHDHDYKATGGLRERKYKVDNVEIGRNVWIGANAVILKGVKLGDNCVVGAGCVVSHGEYPNNSVITQKREMQIRSYTIID